MSVCNECGKVVSGSKFEETDCNIELMKRGFCECTGKTEGVFKCNKCNDTGTKLEWYKGGHVFGEEWICRDCDIHKGVSFTGKTEDVELAESEKYLFCAECESYDCNSEDCNDGLLKDGSCGHFTTMQTILKNRLELQRKEIEERASEKALKDLLYGYQGSIDDLAKEIIYLIKGK